MRKYKKNNILGLMKTVIDVLKEIQGLPKEQKIETLTEIQDAVVSIGRCIESENDNDVKKLISGLEVFAEGIYSLAMHYLNETISETQAARVCEEAGRIYKLLSEEIPVVYEIAFLPYKASMWDCMESVYQASCQAGNCHVTVMPIPYHTLGTVQEIIGESYEGSAFEEKMEIADYHEYDIFSIYPDVIFVHNPYDEYNNVTRIREEYFSKNLSKYTDHLVYIPYYVDLIKLEDIYCMLPGVKYAWRVFVQSERVKETYMKYSFTDKFIVAGSPKIDAVIQAMHNQPEMPEMWRKAFEGKKTFLLNTHLNNIINAAEEMLNKLRVIFLLFNGRNDIALLWRPHPLSIETAKAWSPGILQEYTELIEEFKSMPNAIYDDSPDLHRAIALTDAYIGDTSSLIGLYGVTGKPIIELDNTESARKEMSNEAMQESNRAADRIQSIYFEGKTDLLTFIELVVNEHDTLKRERKEEFGEIFANAQGVSGAAIWDYILNELERE